MSVTGTTRRLPRQVALPRVGLRVLGSVLLVVAVCCLPLAFYAPFFNEPFMRDEGFFATVAQAMRDGGMPYQDGFDNKPPMIFYWYYLSFALFGENILAPRLLVALLLCGTSVMLYFQGRIIGSHRIGLIAAGAFGVSMGFALFETNANVEYFMLPVLVAALLAFTLAQRTGSLLLYALCGFFCGIGVLTKETSAFIVLMYGVVILWPLLRLDGWGARLHAPHLKRFAVWVGGGLASLVVVLLPFALTGTLDDFFDGVVVYSLAYVGHVPLSAKLTMGALGVPRFIVITGPWLVLALVGLVHIRRSGNSEALLVLGWVLAAAAGVIAAGRFYNHYYATLLPGLALAAPYGVESFQRNWRKKRLLVLAAVMPSMFIISVAIGSHVYLQPTPGERHIAKYEGVDMSKWEVESPQLAEYLRVRTGPDDLIFNLGFQSEVYFYADRKSPTRYMFDHPFFISETYEEEAVRDLEANPPKYIWDSAKYEPETWLTNQGRGTPLIYEFIEEHYDHVGFRYYADVYKLKETPEEAARPQP
jgi:4-amino-4-deoxy-L-arabinose transferase-like glycosyltransferase